ncbi:hypothetical protein C0J52_02213, partial [Blattella germanica]
LTKWRIKINVNKCQAVLYTRRTSPTLINPPEITMFGIAIPWTATAKYLGLILDRRLLFGPHIRSVIAKAYSRYWLLIPLMNTKDGLPIKTALLMYKTLLRPIITYASLAWGDLAAYKMAKMQTFQNISIRHHCDVHGPTSQTYNPYVRDFRTDVLDIVITKDISFQFDLNVCVALNSDHYPVILDAHCRASFKAPLTRYDQRRVNWNDYKAAVEDITRNPVVQSAADVEVRLSEFSTVISEALEASATSRRKSTTQASIRENNVDSILQLKSLVV